MPQVGDVVQYSTNGVCRITEKTTLKIAGHTADYFVLRPVFDAGLKITVPCANAALLAHMRPLLTREELLSLLHEPAPAYEQDAEQRREQYRQTLQNGNTRDLLRMIRSIYAERIRRRAQGRQLPVYEDTALHQAQNALHSEIAYLMGITPQEVPDFIARELDAAE